ncbi:acyl-CoA dehydrogenase [Metallumcola ferriviriculae]|uniref:Acyl-CoA dehydrogenase n=1 Tax=Metallumcola ferriviriculae TaxID=3039180 RepID=A0AAU0UPK2_9FIRM|nr:acyl-CoA dehydrogenase [Desulfitibacteraceae bacterium MK1]
MASNFVYDNREQKFIIKEWLDGEKLFGFDAFKDFCSIDDVDMILDQALKVSKEVIAPTNDDGENYPMRLENGKVEVPDSFRSAYAFLNENGWGPSHANPEEVAMPNLLLHMCEEFMGAANYPLMQYIGLTSGSAGLIQAFGDQAVKEMFLPKMFSGDWAGTMCLTETGGGSDVGDLLTKAYPTDDPRVYKIRGTKCFISQGDHELTENIVHLVLARVDGAAPGTKGISLFVVPKYTVNEGGSVGESNDVTTVAIEHKLGMNGSATAMLNFGDNDNCYGILLGNAPDENGRGEGMAQMFQMVNGARMGTGHTALSLAAVAYNNAVEYAKERVQGRPFGQGKKASRVRIIEHEDVRRMLMVQKATIEAMRALIYQTYYYIDIAAHSNDADEKRRAQRRMEVNTPLVKAYCSDTAWQLTAEAIQVYGGYGYSEEYPAARCARDVKILTIWEGTNFIQSLDLLGRKWSMEKGTVFAEWLADIDKFITQHQDNQEFSREINILSTACQSYQEMRNFILKSLQQKPQLMPLYSTRILHSTAMVYCGMILMEQALLAAKQLEQLDAGNSEYNFYKGKVETAKFYLRNIVPKVMMTRDVVLDADTSAIEIPEEAF